jgi:hypothetical protein
MSLRALRNRQEWGSSWRGLGYLAACLWLRHLSCIVGWMDVKTRARDSDICIIRKPNGKRVTMSPTQSGDHGPCTI